MKNIHILPTYKTSRLYYSNNNSELLLCKEPISFKAFERSPQNIYITSDEEIKGKGYRLDLERMSIGFIDDDNYYNRFPDKYKKIILTDNKDLIKDGIQAIDDEFLEWFIKNSNCEYVEVKKEAYKKNGMIDEATSYKHKIMIQKEEPKQKTLEDFIKKFLDKWFIASYQDALTMRDCIKAGYKLAQEQMYSDKEVLNILDEFNREYDGKEFLEDFFEKFKK